VTATSLRTDRAGDLRVVDVDRDVALCGWVASRRDHGGVVFLDLRDAGGVVQVVVDPDAAGGLDPHTIRAEYVLRVEGRVRHRPDGSTNPDLATGEIEVAARTVELLNRADPSPIPIDERVDADEALRLRYRYLDLRSERLQRNLRLRSRVNQALRGALDEQGFVEVETPMLIASTPEGARDFVVPSRRHPGSFYALPQSPQLLKQLLMVGGVDRYYQIARCLRDEDLRADRQFEFMQLDAEMSFADADDVMAVVDGAIRAAVRAAVDRDAGTIGRLTWHESRDRFGTDKPDLRVPLEIVDVSEVLAATEFRAFQADAVRGLCVPDGAELGRGRLDALIERAKGLGAAGLVWMRVRAGSELDSPVARHLADEERLGIVDAFGAKPGDLLLLVAGPLDTVVSVLGALRVEVSHPVDPADLAFTWVVDFPLFEGIDDDGNPIAAHHPFTAPHPEDRDLLEPGRGADLLAVRSRSYDLVVNGWELCSGSVRIHDPALQARVFATLGIEEQVARDRFGFLLDAFRYGAPPHAGFGMGIDRLVAVLADEDNIREVIAFPKTQSGTDPLTGAPSPIDPTQLRDLGLSVTRRR
jgi:aspartyl-tRNA synthetase